MSNKLYVGNISFQASEEDLENHFGQFGSVKSAKIIMDRETGRSKGFGFVEMSSAEEAQNCISNLDGQDFSGRSLRVNEAREREPRQGGGQRNHRW